MTKLKRNLKVFFCFGLSVFIPYYAYIPYKKWKKRLIEVDDELYSVHIDRNNWFAKPYLKEHVLFPVQNQKVLLYSEVIQMRLEMLKEIKDMWLPWSKWYIVYYYLLEQEYMKDPKIVINMKQMPRALRAVGKYYAEVFASVFLLIGISDIVTSNKYHTKHLDSFEYASIQAINQLVIYSLFSILRVPDGYMFLSYSMVTMTEVATSTEMETKKLYVKNLDWNITEEQVKEYFAQYGEIASIKLPLDKFKRRRGFAFIEFTNESDASKAIAAANEQSIGGTERLMSVEMARIEDPVAREARYAERNALRPKHENHGHDHHHHGE